MSKVVNILVLLVILLISTQKAIAADFVPGEVIVKFKDSNTLYKAFEESTSSVQGITSPDSSQIFTSKYNSDKKIFAKTKRTKFINVSTVVPIKKQKVAKGIMGIKDSSISEVEKVAKITFDKNTSVDSVITELTSDPNVEYAEPNFKGEIYTSPSDPLYQYQWGFNETQGSSVEKSWTIKDTAPSVKICIVDSGISDFYADFTSNIFWTNPLDPVNNLDDDKNGYIDDVNGWNFQLNNNRAFAYSTNHGTLVASIIAASKNNNIAQAGILSSTKFITITVASILGDFDVSKAIPAVKYAADSGCKIMNNSWGGMGYSAALGESFNYAKNKGVLVVNASGNSGMQVDKSSNFSFPVSYDLDNFINVGSYNVTSMISDFSNYSNSLVHIAAPGEKIPFAEFVYSGQYTLNDGTSFAAPFVTGVAALIWEKNPTWTYTQVKDAILNGSDTVSTWTSKIQNGRKLNAYKALTYTSSTNYVYDIDGNGKENLTDIILHLGYVLDKPYDARFDYNNDKAVRLTDTLILLARVLK